jgi:hypothetical protein
MGGVGTPVLGRPLARPPPRERCSRDDEADSARMKLCNALREGRQVVEPVGNRMHAARCPKAWI